MLVINPITFQAVNMAIAGGICTFVLSYMLGKYWLTWPVLDARLATIQSTYRFSNDAMYLAANLTTDLSQQRKKKGNQKRSLKNRALDYVLKNPFLKGESLKASFEQAGWVLKDVHIIFLTSKIISSIAGLGIGYFIFLSRPSFAQSLFPLKGIILTVTACSGWLLPDLYLKGKIKTRVALIEKQFPDALDLIIICLQAGLGLNRAIERVAKEITIFGKEIAYELSLMSIELEIMLDRRQALQNLHARVPSGIIRSFSTSVLQSIQQGTPTLQALEVLSHEIRDARMQAAEAKAAKLPSLMVIPLVLFVMPNLFIVLLGPALVRLMNVT